MDVQISRTKVATEVLPLVQVGLAAEIARRHVREKLAGIDRTNERNARCFHALARDNRNRACSDGLRYEFRSVYG
jgi:hypothetical protein